MKFEKLPETWHNPKIRITGRKFKVIRKFDWTKISEFCQKIDKTDIKFKQPKTSLQYKIQIHVTKSKLNYDGNHPPYATEIGATE